MRRHDDPEAAERIAHTGLRKRQCRDAEPQTPTYCSSYIAAMVEELRTMSAPAGVLRGGLLHQAYARQGARRGAAVTALRRYSRDVGS